MHQPQLLQL